MTVSPGSAPRAYRAFLFDMDGTLITSTAAAERVWTRWAERHGIDPVAFIPTIHGVRTADTIRLFDPPMTERLDVSRRIATEKQQASHLK